MEKIQKLSLNIFIFVGVCIVLYSFPILNMERISLFLMAISWPYIYHFRKQADEKKHNRLSLFWFIDKVYRWIKMIPNNFLRELVLVLLPYLVITFLLELFKSDIQTWPFLIGIVLFEISFIVTKLIKPNYPTKKE